MIALALCAPFLRAGSVSLDGSFPPSTRPTLQVLADEVWNIVGELFPRTPPLDLPVNCHFSRAAVPMTRVDGDAIAIRITASGSYYAQFAFQLGHELGHVMLDPRRSNGIVEAICIAVSYEVLDRIGPRIELSPRLPWLADYAPHFEEYREQDQKSMLSKLPRDVSAMVAQRRWADISAYLREHRSDLAPGSPLERPTQTLAAIALRATSPDYAQFTGVAACTDPSPEQDPRFRILPLRPACLESLGIP